MACSVHPVFVTYAGEPYEILFMSEDDAFAFAERCKRDLFDVKVEPSVRLNETPDEGMTALLQMLNR